jgi:hypothetical protein
VLLVRGATLSGWRFIGFGAALDPAHETTLALDASGVIGEAVATGTAASTATAGTLLAPPFDLPEGRDRVAVPIPMSGQVVAVLYADQGPQDDPAHTSAIAWRATGHVSAHAARSRSAHRVQSCARPHRRPARRRTAPGADGSPGVGHSSEDDESRRDGARGCSCPRSR